MTPASEPRPFYVTRPWLAAALAVGIAAAGSVKLIAQDVPPPPPDAQSTQQDQQQAPDPVAQSQYGGDPSQQQQQPQYPQDQQGQPGQPAPQGQPLPVQQIDQLVAPIALYPDSLVAQILAGATYPTQIVEADRWREQQGNASADQIAAGANAQQWDPSVKALTAFPSVLSQMDKNLQWTTDLGNAYYNQPQDVMDSVQRMRQRAQSSGSLQNTQQQTVTDDGGSIAIAPANPDVVYVPVYNPWAVYGPPIVAFPGYFYAPPPGIFIGVGFGYRVGFGYGIPIRPWAPWGWGFRSWGVGWGNRAVFYNRTTYITRSTTVINRGFNRPGGPPVQLAGSRGSFVNHPGYAGYANRVASGARPAGFVNHPGPVSNGEFNHAPQTYNRPANGVNGQQFHSTPGNTATPRSTYTPGNTYNRPNSGATAYRPSAPAQNYSRPAQTQNSSRPSAPVAHSAPAPHAAPAPHGGGGGGEHHH